MIVVIANDLPPAVRGRMKLWFIEPRPNVFVSGIKDSTAEYVANYLFSHCPPESGLLVIKRIPKAPGYAVLGTGDISRGFTEISGLQLILERDAPQYPV
jgi:CRISPR-associated protein Cas2